MKFYKKFTDYITEEAGVPVPAQPATTQAQAQPEEAPQPAVAASTESDNKSEIDGLLTLSDEQKKNLRALVLSINNPKTDGKKIQRLVNLLTGAKLTEDGIVGNKTQQAIMSLKSALMQVKGARQFVETDVNPQTGGRDGFFRVGLKKAIATYLGIDTSIIKNFATATAAGKSNKPATPKAKVSGGAKPAQPANNNTATKAVKYKPTTNELVGAMNNLSELAKNNYDPEKVSKSIYNQMETIDDIEYVWSFIRANVEKQKATQLIVNTIKNYLDDGKEAFIYGLPQDTKMFPAEVFYAYGIKASTEGTGTNDEYLNLFFNDVKNNNVKKYNATKARYKALFGVDMKEDLHSDTGMFDTADWSSVIAEIDAD